MLTVAAAAAVLVGSAAHGDVLRRRGDRDAVLAEPVQDRRVISSLTARAARTGTTKRADSSTQLSVARTNTLGSTSARPTG